MSEKKVKCVVWDLDNTLWNGILSEGDDIQLNKTAVKVIEELDKRGILQSISSKNDYQIAIDKLKDFGLDIYFLYPQINWNNKSKSIYDIAASLNIGIDTFAFIDDQLFEREEVQFSHNDVLCIDAAEISKILEMDEFKPKFQTEDSKNRRLMYMHDINRNQVENDYEGPKEDFLATLDMVFTISKAKEDDLKRVEELTIRTHQLNSTGTVYSYEELVELVHSDKHIVLISQLDDKFGSYGKIGISVVEKNTDSWCIKLLLMSCRVMSKGVGSVMLNYIMKCAVKNNVKLYADFISTDRNRIMYITYKFNGYKEISNVDKKIKFEANLHQIGEDSNYIKVIEKT